MGARLFSKLIKRPLVLFMVFVVAFYVNTLCLAEVYKYKDEQGKWQYSDKPPPGGQATEAIKGVTKKKPTSSNLEEEQKAEIISVVNEWANAWSQQNVDAYLAFYGEEFNPPKNMSRDEWVTQRKVMLRKPKFIKVEIDKPVAILLGGGHAQVSFSQVYQSDNYKDKVKKTLMMKNIDRRWQIIEEISN
jgi:hypothetical protein